MDLNEQDASIYPNGTIIADRYEITSFLAQGGMAQVYVAKQQQIDRPVALKVLSPSFSMNSGVVMRFFREAHVVGKLQHPNTIRIYDMGETPDNRLFIAMELLDGEELSERIKRGPIPAAEMFPIIKQVAGSLSEAHQKGIIHRDLKPDNIFLTKMNVVKVLDFGIAKFDDESQEREKKLTKVGTAPGTPEYMSPEQARGKDLDARSDLYSLGIVMYEMLCGHPPFEESTYLGTILLQVQSPPPPLPEDIPLQLRNYIINRMLAKDPNCRPDNAEVFIQEMDELAVKLKIVKDEKEEEEQLSKAKAEIELLKSQLAQTKLELLRSGDCNILSESVMSAGAPSLDLPKPDASGSTPGVIALNRAELLNMQQMRSGVMPVMQQQGPGSMQPAGPAMMQQMRFGNMQQAGPSVMQPQGAMQIQPAGPAMMQQMRSGVMPVMQQPTPVAMQPQVGIPMQSQGAIPMQPAGPAMMQQMRSGVMPVMSPQGAMQMQQQGAMQMQQQGAMPMQQQGAMQMQQQGAMQMQQQGAMQMQQQGAMQMQQQGAMQMQQQGAMQMQPAGPAVMQQMRSGVMPTAGQMQPGMRQPMQQQMPSNPMPQQMRSGGMPSMPQGMGSSNSGSRPGIQRMPANANNASHGADNAIPDEMAAPQSSSNRMPRPPQARSYSNLPPTSRDDDEEPVIAPLPRHKARSMSTSSQGNERIDRNEASGMGRKEVSGKTRSDNSGMGRRSDASGDFDLDAQSMTSRPKDTMSGSVANKKHSASTNREMTFMMFAQPLCSKMGPEKSTEALELARSVWNATIMGKDAIRVLYESAQGRANLTKLIQLMTSRKEMYFPEEDWIIEEMKVNIEPNGRMELNLLTRL